MKPQKSKVSITLDSDVIEDIKRLAEDDNRSFSMLLILMREFPFWYAVSIHSEISCHKFHKQLPPQTITPVL